MKIVLLAVGNNSYWHDPLNCLNSCCVQPMSLAVIEGGCALGSETGLM